MTFDAPSLPRLSPAPRSLSPTLSARVVFGGFIGQFGWIFVAFGMLFVWVFDAGAGLTEWIRFHGDVATVEGRTTQWRETSLSIGDVPVYETSYSFRLSDGRSVDGASYATGSWVANNQAVVVEYIDRDPSVSRIQGMRASSGGLGVIFIFIFPLVGLALGIAGMRTGLKARRLMSVGHLTRGTLLTSEATNTTINNRPVMRLTFEFEASRGGTFQAVAKSHQPERLQDEDRELLVYDPQNPQDAALLDELPCQPRVNDVGDFEASRPGLPAAAYLLLPGVSVLTLARYLLTLF